IALFGMADSGRWALVRRPLASSAEAESPAPAASGKRDDEAIENAVRSLLRRWGVVFWKLIAMEADWLPPWRDILMCCRRLEARGEICRAPLGRGYSRRHT